MTSREKRAASDAVPQELVSSTKASDMREIVPRAARLWLAGLLPLAFALFYLSNPRPSGHFDYTYRIAGELLHGRCGTTETPPSWLNEMVPMGDRYYSVFPLGSVLTMLPLALLGCAGLISGFPGRVVASTVAALMILVFFHLSARFADTLPRRFLLAIWAVFGTWTWCNLSCGGAWQIALGVAMLAEAAALYFTLVSRRPFWAGFYFAMAFGNRTEILLTAPLFLYLLFRPETGAASQRPPRSEAVRSLLRGFRERWGDAVWFVAIPFVLGVLTLSYNHARFSSITDFGYARIPGVLAEPWYQQGIFSLHAIPTNAEKMLWDPWRRLARFPYYAPSAWGGSIFLSSPLLLLLFHWRARERGLQVVSWLAILVLTFVLWCHGNPGGWQYSYRYAMVLIPWMFLVLQANGSAKLGKVEAALLALSIAMNAWATYLYNWTPYVQA
jgi:hypothetical protein